LFELTKRSSTAGGQELDLSPKIQNTKEYQGNPKSPQWILCSEPKRGNTLAGPEATAETPNTSKSWEEETAPAFNSRPRFFNSNWRPTTTSQPNRKIGKKIKNPEPD
jgi:hypothetical protein